MGYWIIALANQEISPDNVANHLAFDAEQELPAIVTSNPCNLKKLKHYFQAEVGGRRADYYVFYVYDSGHRYDLPQRMTLRAKDLLNPCCRAIGVISFSSMHIINTDYHGYIDAHTFGLPQRNEHITRTIDEKSKAPPLKDSPMRGLVSVGPIVSVNLKHFKTIQVKEAITLRVGEQQWQAPQPGAAEKQAATEFPHPQSHDEFTLKQMQRLFKVFSSCLAATQIKLGDKKDALLTMSRERVALVLPPCIAEPTFNEGLAVLSELPHTLQLFQCVRDGADTDESWSLHQVNYSVLAPGEADITARDMTKRFKQINKQREYPHKDHQRLELTPDCLCADANESRRGLSGAVAIQRAFALAFTGQVPPDFVSRLQLLRSHQRMRDFLNWLTKTQKRVERSEKPNAVEITVTTDDAFSSELRERLTENGFTVKYDITEDYGMPATLFVNRTHTVYVAKPIMLTSGEGELTLEQRRAIDPGFHIDNCFAYLRVKKHSVTADQRFDLMVPVYCDGQWGLQTLRMQDANQVAFQAYHVLEEITSQADFDAYVRLTQTLFDQRQIHTASTNLSLLQRLQKTISSGEYQNWPGLLKGSDTVKCVKNRSEIALVVDEAMMNLQYRPLMAAKPRPPQKPQPNSVVRNGAAANPPPSSSEYDEALARRLHAELNAANQAQVEHDAAMAQQLALQQYPGHVANRGFHRAVVGAPSLLEEDGDLEQVDMHSHGKGTQLHAAAAAWSVGVFDAAMRTRDTTPKASLSFGLYQTNSSPGNHYEFSGYRSHNQIDQILAAMFRCVPGARFFRATQTLLLAPNNRKVSVFPCKSFMSIYKSTQDVFSALEREAVLPAHAVQLVPSSDVAGEYYVRHFTRTDNEYTVLIADSNPGSRYRHFLETESIVKCVAPQHTTTTVQFCRRVHSQTDRREFRGDKSYINTDIALCNLVHFAVTNQPAPFIIPRQSTDRALNGRGGILPYTPLFMLEQATLLADIDERGKLITEASRLMLEILTNEEAYYNGQRQQFFKGMFKRTKHKHTVIQYILQQLRQGKTIDVDELETLKSQNKYYNLSFFHQSHVEMIVMITQRYESLLGDLLHETPVLAKCITVNDASDWEVMDSLGEGGLPIDMLDMSPV